MMVWLDNCARLCAVATLALLITACAATGPSYTQMQQSSGTLESGHARLYFMRGSDLVNAGLVARVHIDGIKVANLKMGGFFFTDHPAGQVKIMIDAPLNYGEAKQLFEAESGKTHYFVVDNNMGNVLVGSLVGALGTLRSSNGRFTFRSIPEAEGLNNLTTMKFSGSQ